jgi:hypothetical protein
LLPSGYKGAADRCAAVGAAAGVRINTLKIK